jgi:molecular chaperone Hsp33
VNDHGNERPEAAANPASPEHETALARYRRLAAERATGPTQYLDPAPEVHKDTLWRGLSRGGEARLLVTRAGTAVQEATQRTDCSPDVAKLLGELIVATALLRSTLNPDERIQVLVSHKGPVGQIVVDAWEQGGVRAYVQRPQMRAADYGFLLGEGQLQVSRSRELARRPYRSTIALEGGGIAHEMMRYLLESEQILSLLELHVDATDAGVCAASGFLVQLMPEGNREHIQQLAKNLAAAPRLHQSMTPSDPDARAWAEQVMQGLPWDQVARGTVAFQCRCSEDRILAMLATLPRRDVAELASSREMLEMTCDYCGTVYHLPPQRVQVLLEAPS